MRTTTIILLVSLLAVFCGQSVHAQTSAPANEITFTFNEIESDTTTPYHVTARYYSPVINYCYLRITDDRKVNYPVLMMRLGASHNKLWVTTFVETYFTGARDTSSIFLADYNATTVTPLLDENNQFIGVEVDWVFTLIKDTDSPYANENGYWNTEENLVYFGVYLVGQTEVGYNDSAIPVLYLNANNPTIPADWTNGRGLYIWPATNEILESAQAQREFFSFTAAPHGTPENAVKTLFMNFDAKDIVSADFNAVAAFIADAHSRGLTVHYLTGDPSWALAAYQSYSTDHLNRVFLYNAAAPAEARFDGIQFNIEPHVLPGWPSDSVWQEYIYMMGVFQSMVDAHNVSAGDSILFGATIPYWYEEHTYNARPVNQYIQDITDYITVINYWTLTGATGLSVAEIAYSSSINKPASVYIALETMNLQDSDPYSYISFWNHGVESLETMIADLETIYAQYNSFKGTAIHYYETSAAADESYRKLRPDSLSAPNQDYNEAPVCTILTPNNGEYTLDAPLTITYSIYDNDTDTLNLSFYLSGDAGDVQVGSDTIVLSGAIRTVSGSYAFTPANYALPQGVFDIIVVVEEAAGTLSTTDQSNQSITLSAPIYHAPAANAGGPYFGTEGTTIILNATASSDPQSSALSYQWDLNSDGIYETSGTTPSFAVDNDTTATVSLQVTNAYNLSSVDTTQITIANAAPVMGTLIDQDILLGDTATLPPATYTDAGTLDTHTALISWGDTSYTQFAVSDGVIPADHTYSEAGVYTAVVSVTDDSGDSGQTSFSVTVTQLEQPVSYTHDDALSLFDTIITTAYSLPAGRTKNKVIRQLETGRSSLHVQLDRNDYTRAISKSVSVQNLLIGYSDDLGLSDLLDQLIAIMETL